MKAANRFKDPPVKVNELWKTDFSYLKVVHWGWYYLTTILDDYSRYIITWELCRTMRSDDLERVVSKVLDLTGLGIGQPPRLLSDNGSCHVSGDLKEFLDQESIWKSQCPRPLIARGNFHPCPDISSCYETIYDIA